MSLLSSICNLAVLGRAKDYPGLFDRGQVKKILVVRNDNIGDVLCSSPALDAIRKAFPKAYLAMAVCTLARDAAEGHRALDRLYVYPKAKHGHYGRFESLKRLGAMLGELRKENFDLAIALRSGFSTSQAWITYASRARWRLGPAAQGKKARWGFYYNLPVQPPGPGLHEVERCFHLLSAIDLDTEPEKLYLKVPEDSRRKIREFLQNNDMAQRGAPVVLNITRWAYDKKRSWPADRYQGLISYIMEQGVPLVVSHAPADEKWVQGLLKDLPERPAVFWSKSLKDFAALAKAARLFVTAEGGPMHIACAVGAPQVIIWSDTDLATWRPWKADLTVLGGKGPVNEVTLSAAEQAVRKMLARTA